jgi:hypothetical protein
METIARSIGCYGYEACWQGKNEKMHTGHIEHMHSRILCLEDKINIQVRFHVHKGRHWISGKFRVTHLYYWKSHAEPSI